MDVLFSDPSLLSDAKEVSRPVTVSSPQFGQVTLANRSFSVGGMNIELKPKEAQLVRLLLEAEGSIVPIVRLKGELGYRPDTNTHTVENHIYRIRERLRASNIGGLIQCTTAGRNSNPDHERGYSLAVKSP
jgi:DNA-binding response OmpR family regulator